ncbi:TPA: replication initiation factor domain-containing protein, partial [Enterococcus faecium]|nr:replication protein [Enterococcus faecium]HDU0587942.1 replication protein [Enterococcus faecium]HDU0651542.1 replication protein [Enterococcus faecium]
MGKKRTIVNEWEKLTAPSNRRLNVGESVKMIKMDWSIDRITIVGTLNENIYYHTQNDVLILDFEQLMRVNEGNGHLKAVGNNGWQLVDQHEENIAYIEILKWQEGKGRIDFNPNKISQFLASSMK